MKKNLPHQATFFSLLRHYARPVWKEISVLVVITLVANLFTVAQPIVVSGIVDVIREYKADAIPSIQEQPLNAGGDSFFNLNSIGRKVKEAVYRVLPQKTDNIWSTLIFMLALFLFCVLLSSLLNYLALVLTRWIRTRCTHLVRRDALQHLLNLNLGFYHQEKAGELISRIIQDSENTGQGLGPLVRSYLHHTVLIVMYSTYLISTSVWMTVCAFFMIMLQFGLTELIKKPVRRRTRTFFDKVAELTSTLQETLTSIRVVKSFGVEDYEMEKLEKDLNAVRKAGFQDGVIRHIEPHAREFLDAVAFIGIFVVASMQLMNGSLSLQGFLLYIYVGRLLIQPVNKFAVSVTWTQALLASYERLSELFAQKSSVKDGSTIKTEFAQHIEIRDVNFSYGSERDFSLNHVDFTLHKGEVVALVGPSGAGKSTLTDLILRFYDPTSGGIFIDGINLKELKVSVYRKIFGVVPQESLLFNDSIGNNIAYGRDNVSQADIIEAAQTANAHDFILDLPDGYDTVVGDRGVRLSGGQRQRIAIARAIVAKPDILIFDEATSSLDTQSEKQVQAAVDSVLERCTAIVIAHRLSTILNSDRIIVLNKGQVEAIGTHKELLKISGLYQQLYHLQFETQHDLVRA